MTLFAGRYQLLRKLGEGGMGEVYLAHDRGRRVECAIKQLWPHLADPLAALRRELIALTRVRHPSIVRVFEGAVAPEGRPYLSLEYVPGVPAQLASVRGEWEALYALGCRVAEGLEALHRVGVVHGDVKPSNILVVEDRGRPLQIRLVDFGLAALRGHAGGSGRGTIDFAAPEVTAGGPVSAASDLYGLGASLYALITGAPPGQRDGTVILGGGASPSAAALERSGAPWPLIELVLSLMAERPEERPASARVLRHEFERRSPAARIPLASRIDVATLIGRAHELGEFEDWLHAHHSKASRVHRIRIVAGAPGSGRSALLRAFATRATLGGWSVVSLEGSDASAALATLAALVAPTPAPDHVPIEEGNGTRLAGPGEFDPREILGRLAQPTLVVIDDFDRLGEEDAVALRRQMLLESEAPILWVIAQTLQEDLLVVSGMADVTALGNLTRPHARRLIAVRLGCAPPPQIEDYLWRHALGHCGQTVEVLRWLVSRGAMAEREHGLEVAEDALAAPPPAGRRARSQERLRGLDATSLRILLACAVRGALDFAEIRECVPEARECERDLLLREGLLAARSDGALHCSAGIAELALEHGDRGFERALREAALARPDTTPRARFAHARALGRSTEALAAAEEAFARDPDLELARAAAACAAGSDARLAARWQARVGDLLRRAGRFAAATPHYREALAQTDDAEERATLGNALATALLRAGDARQSLDVIKAALPEARGPVAHRLVANRSFARALLNDSGAESDARGAFAAARAAGDGVAMGMAAATLVRLASERKDLAAVEKWLRRAELSYLRAKDHSGYLRSLASRVQLLLDRGDLKGAARQAAKAVQLARAHGRRLALTELLRKRFVVEFSAGDWDGARKSLQEALRVAVEDGRRGEAALAMVHMAQVEGLMSNPRAARRHARGALRLARRDHPELVPYAWRSLAQAERVAGRLRAALQAARQAHLAAGTGPGAEAQWCRAEYARVLLCLHRPDEASPILAGGLAASEAPGPADAMLRVLAARHALMLRQPSRAGDLLAEAERILRQAPSRYVAAHLDLARAQRALQTDSISNGLERLQDGLAQLGDLRALWDRADAALEIATAAPKTVETREAIAAHLDNAARTFERLGDRRSRERALLLMIEWLKSDGRSGAGRELGLLERVSWLLTSLTDLDQLLKRAMRAAAVQLGAERGLLLLANQASGELEKAAEFGHLEPTARSEALRYSRQVVRQVTEGRDSVLVVDAGSDPRTSSAPSVIEMKVRSILCAPMLLDGKPIGAVYLDDRRRTHAFAEADRNIIEGFSQLIALAIDKSRSHEAVIQANQRLQSENVTLKGGGGRSLHRYGIVGSSAPMCEVLESVECASRTESTVLITGENGTGKELVAHALHESGKLAGGPFVQVNCGAITDSLLESELFGVLRNVATGVDARIGKFVQADGGTLFLDEIGEMALHRQVTLLSALQSREVTPVGGRKPVPFRARIIAATNQNLRALVEAGKFRIDLFYRLSVIELHIPPLRERKADIPALCHAFLARFAAQQDRPVPQLSADFFDVIMRSDWPGNVRELQNYLEQLMALNSGPLLKPFPPPYDLRGGDDKRPKARGHLPRIVAELDKRVLLDTLQRNKGNQSRTARDLGISEQSVRYRLRKYGLTTR